MSVAAPMPVAPVAASLPRRTAADLLTMPDEDRYELVDGELVERERSNESSWIGGEVYRRLANWVVDGSLGWAFPDNTGYQCFGWDEDRVRKPDASYISKARLPDGPLTAGYCPFAPDLVVEVVSPHDLYLDVEEKVLEYLRAGVRMVWVVTPSTRTILVHQSEGSLQWLKDADELSGDPVLPGFRCRVGDLFPPRPAAASR